MILYFGILSDCVKYTMVRLELIGVTWFLVLLFFYDAVGCGAVFLVFFLCRFVVRALSSVCCCGVLICCCIILICFSFSRTLCSIFSILVPVSGSLTLLSTNIPKSKSILMIQQCHFIVAKEVSDLII